MILFSILAALLALLSASLAFNFILWRDCRKVQRDLLDRLMARDWTDYRALTTVRERPAPRKWSMSDEKEADIEKARKEAARA